ncbi:FxLD family lanthipeptide [Kitasatospora sp. NBC_01300]|uniref:FxLD family lanthipeptide n=1 Tax=Kitasatospora sp. NBC_01300 TaxID=2903574 RepID=UPI00352EE72D|nr:FxLD family lanthipeptide [Kitasatospora sp. NBC_01300]
MDSTTEFDLDVSIVRNTNVLSAIMRSTDDGCGSTCPACASGAGGGGGNGGGGGGGEGGGGGGEGGLILA